jgi:2-hydroxy-3-keto-5-methylthiopentenyl-1-phosphate phosphatase
MIVFSDFDGTITTEDTFVKMVKHFIPEITEQLLPEIYNQRLTLRQGVRQLLTSIPSKRYPEILDFLNHETRQKGFAEFVDFLHENQIKILVISGGVKVIVERVLGELLPKIDAIHAIKINTNQEYLQIYSDFEQGTELVDKVEVIKSYQPQDFIVIGDSITDLNMALYSPVVFAKYPLSKYLDERQKKYRQWDDFFDIIKYLETVQIN